jgi:pimeloyl-ACP methyl ester carboxylesterase
VVDHPKKGAPWWSASGTTLAADGTPLAFASGGPRNGRALVCCNGVGVSTFFWDYLGEYFSRDHRVIVWDYRGHGASGRAQNLEALTMASLADDLARVLDANAIGAAVLLGHSMGCQVILEFVRLFPQRVIGLVPILGAFGRAADTFIDPRIGPRFYQSALTMTRKLPDLMNIACRVMLKSPIAWPFTRRSGLVHRDLCKREDMEPYLEHLSSIDIRVFFEMVRCAQEHDAGPYLAEIQAPALIVAGERDLFTPRRLSLEMAERIPNAELLEIPRGSHAALIEQPELINLRLEKFIRDRVIPYERTEKTKRNVI